MGTNHEKIEAKLCIEKKYVFYYVEGNFTYKSPTIRLLRIRKTGEILNEEKAK